VTFGLRRRGNQDRIRQRPIGVKSLIVVLALLLTACSSGGHATAARPTTTVAVAKLGGWWQPVSIAGYDGPLTSPPLGSSPLLRFDGNGAWNGSDGCNSLAGAYQLSTGGTFHLAEHVSTAVGCLPGSTVPIPLAAVRVDARGRRLTFFARNGTRLAVYERVIVF